MVDDFSEDDRLIEPKAVLRQLRSLVHYDPQTSKVELAHSSVRDFPTSPQRSGRFYIDPSKARVTMTRVCIGYLIAPEFKLMCPDMESLEQRINDWPLFHYASSCWTRYVQGLNPLPDDVNILASRLIASADLPCAGNWASWYQCVYPFPYGDPTIWATRPLYMCAREGLTHLLEGILPGCDKKQLEQRGAARGSTALHIAATYGQVDAVRLLLAAGADPNERNGEGQSGIRLAVLFEHEETVQELLKGGADPELLHQPIVGGVRQY